MSEIEKEYQQILLVFGNMATGVALLPVLVALWQRKYLNQPLKLMLIYLLALMGHNLLSQILYWSFNEYYYTFWKPILEKLEIYDTNFLNIIGRTIDYIFVGWIFSYALKEPLGSNLKKASWGLIPVVFLVYFFVDGYTSYGTVNAILNRAYLVAVSAIYFWYLFNSPPTINLWKNPFFLIGLGLFIPNLFGLLMSFTGAKLSETDYPLFVKISLFRNAFTVLAQFLFALAFYHAKYVKFLKVSNSKI